MKQSLGLKAAVMAIQERYKIKEGLARRLARAEVDVLKRTYSSLETMSEDKILQMRYAAPSNAVNVIRDVNIPALIFNIQETPEAQMYVNVIQEVVMMSPETEETSMLEQSLDKPSNADIERLLAQYDKSAARLGKVPGEGGLFRVIELEKHSNCIREALLMKRNFKILLRIMRW
jgi:hypothetical protein